MPGSPTQSRAGGLRPVDGFSTSILVCVDCEQEFVFTASAQQYFAERGFLEPPKRCKSCYHDYRNNQAELDAEAAAQTAAEQESSTVPETSAGPETSITGQESATNSETEEPSAA